MKCDTDARCKQYMPAFSERAMMGLDKKSVKKEELSPSIRLYLALTCYDVAAGLLMIGEDESDVKVPEPASE